MTQDICCGEPATKLLYTTPESLAKPRLRDALKEAAAGGSLYLFAVDEAHCMSQVMTRLWQLAPEERCPCTAKRTHFVESCP